MIIRDYPIIKNDYPHDETVSIVKSTPQGATGARAAMLWTKGSRVHD